MKLYDFGEWTQIEYKEDGKSPLSSKWLSGHLGEEDLYGSVLDIVWVNHRTDGFLVCCFYIDNKKRWLKKMSA
jgi:hypothetical protein